MDSIKNWNIPERAIILFCSLYLFFYIFPFPLMGQIAAPFTYLQESLTFIIGNQILGIKNLETIERTGSGDTTFSYISIITTLLLAFALTIPLILIKREKLIQNIFTWLYTYSRYYLGTFLLIYGIAKFMNGGQFGELSIYNLEQTLGDKSPMGLLWTFMGYSKTYTIFTGIVEVLAGLLLFFRRTKIIGSLISIAAMTNVMLLNYCYDVPVKLFSTHLVLISVFIISPFIKSLFDFFILKKKTQLDEIKITLPKPWGTIKNISKYIVLGGAFIFVMIQLFISNSSENEELLLEGKNKVELFVINNDTIQPIQTDSVRWKKLLVSNKYSNTAQIIFMNDSTQNFQYFEIEDKQQIRLKPFGNSQEIYKLNYEQMDSSNYQLQGIFLGDSIEIHINNIHSSELPLIKRPFHWIQEYPFNR